MLVSGFENTTLKEKILLYLLIPMILGLILYFIKNSAQADNTVATYSLEKKKILPDATKITQVKTNEMIKLIETLITYYAIELDSLNVNDKTLDMSFICKEEKVMPLLKKLKLHFDIEFYKISRTNAKISLIVKIKSKYFFHKNLFNKEYFYKKVRKKSQVFTIVPEAIINNNVLIENNWYRVGDTLHSFVIRSISDELVVLFDKKNQVIKKVRVNNEPL